MIAAKPAIKRKSSNGSLKGGGVAQARTNGIESVKQSQSLIEQVDVVRAYPGRNSPGVQLNVQRHSPALVAGYPMPARKRGGSMQHNSIQQQYPNSALQPQQRQVDNQSHTLPTRQQQRALRQDPSFHLRQLHPHHHQQQQQQHVRQRHHQGYSSRTLPNSASKREQRALAAAAAGHQCTCSSASSSSHASPSKANRPRSLEFSANGAAIIQPTGPSSLYPPMMSARAAVSATANVARQQTVDFDDSSSAMSGLNYGSSSDAGPQTPETATAPPMIGGAAAATARSHYYQDGRIYDVPEGVEQPEQPSADEASAAQPLPLPSQAVHSPSSTCSTVSAAVQPPEEQHETSTAKKKKKVW